MRQIKVVVGSVTNRKSVIVNDNATPRDAFVEADIDYAGATVQLDGINLGIGDLDRTFSELGVIGESCMLISVVKADNA